MSGTELRLVVLGGAGPYPDAHNWCSGYLVGRAATRYPGRIDYAAPGRDFRIG